MNFISADLIEHIVNGKDADTLNSDATIWWKRINPPLDSQPATYQTTSMA